MDTLFTMRGRIIAASALAAAAGLALSVTSCGGGGYGGGGSGSAMYSIGGTVSGLAAGDTLVLQDRGTDNKTITANGPFAFSTTLTYGMAYNVTVLTQPATPAQTCTVTNGTGTVGYANVTNVTVTCI